MEFIIFTIFCFRNYVRAKAASLPASLWALYTFLAMVLSWFVGVIIVTAIMLIRDPRLRSMLMSQTQDRKELTGYLATQNLIIPQMFMLFCMVGGYLFTRHLIIKKAGDSPGGKE